MMVPAGKSSPPTYRNPEFVWCCRLGYGWHSCVLTANFKSKVCGNGIKMRASEFYWKRLWEFMPLLWNINTISTYHLFCIYKYTFVHGGRGIYTTFFSCKYRDTFMVIPSCMISAQAVSPRVSRVWVQHGPWPTRGTVGEGQPMAAWPRTCCFLRSLDHGVAF